MPSSTTTPMLYNSSSLFEHFVQANTLKQIQSIFYQICITEGIDSTDFSNIYPLLRKIDEGKSNSKAEKLWTFLDKRRNFPEYGKQKICKDMNVLIIGAGPCGLRAGIEAALLGAKVIIVEQRDKFSRNNVLHLWEFVIQDLKALGAKIFYPKFCTGSIEHISIRQLQCILTKVALVLGVQIYDGISFSEILEPTSSSTGWKAKFEPHTHLLSEFQFDVLIGADGKRNTLPGFPKQVVRGKLAIGITANFVNKKSSAEEKVQEISGVAYIFNQTFFKDMQAKTGIDLENIVYYKDETHYFVMCAKKQSLLSKGVIKKDNDDINLLLSRENVDQEMLCKYAMQAADFATEGKLPQLEYSMNHRGQCDVAMFDFTALYSALHSTHLIERFNKSLIVTIVGDSLHEPFWPTGSGCARGFLGVFDAAWMLRSFGLNQLSAAEIIAERENVLKLLAQTTKEKMCKSYHKYTINPKTRYQHIARSVELQQIIECQIDTDNPQHQFDEFHLPLWFNAKNNDEFDRKCRLLRFCQQALSPLKIKIINFKALNWADGRALTALVSKFRKDLIDYANLLSYNDPDYMLDQVFTALEQEYSIQRPCCSQLAWANQSDERRIDFIEEVFNTLRCDPTSAAQILSPSVVKTALTSRKRVKKFDATTKMKRSEQIKRRAGDLMNAMASTSVMMDPYHNSETADDDEILTVSTTTTTSDLTPSKQEYRIELQTTPGNSYFQKSAKTYTPRPVVDKLNPTIVCKVEQIVNGSLQRDHYKQLYDEKHRIAEKITKKMEKESLGKIEEILEQTANGTLIDKNNRQQSLSSQEEKMMRLNAASARDFAKTDFTKKQPEKFKEIDEKLAKAENILKFQNLAGINTVTDFRKQQQPKIPPPTPPKPAAPSSSSSSFDEERENRGENGVVFRSTKYPFRRPVSSPQDLYASVLPRRRNLCALCGIEVYLAEQMHIDKLMIHKKCFKCSYCLQPLRLGNSALDRSLMDEFGPRWYCQQHNMLHISEKITRIQKNENKFADKNRVSIAVVPPSAVAAASPAPLPSRPMLAGQKPSYSSTESNSSTIYTTSNALSNSNNSFEHRQHDSYNSPTALARRTLDRMAARQAQVDALATPTTTTTAPTTTTTARRPSTSPTTVTAPEERVEFECYRGQKINNNDDSQESDGGKKSLESTSSNELESSLDDIEFIDGGSSDNDGFAEAVSCTTTEDEMDNDEELWSEFSQVLENTLAKGATCSSDDISEQQAVKWIDIFNRRASLLKQQSTPQTPDSVYFTPKQRRSDETPIREFYTPATSVRPRLSQTRMKSFESPDADETLKFDSDNHSTLPSSSAGTYTTIISTSDDYTSKKSSIFDSMPSMQRATLSLGSRHRSRSPPPPIPAHISPPRSFDTTPKRPIGMMAKLYNNSIPETSTAASKIGASESQKEANIINKMKKLRMRTNERRATVGIDFGTNQSLLEEAKEREKEIEKREKLFEEKKQQQNAINSGTTTTIEILDNTTSTSKPIFYTPTEPKPSNAKHQTRYSDPDKRKERRLRSRTTGIQKDHLQEAMKKISPALVASPKNIKKVQKQAEKILKRQECERQRTAQDVQRGLDETENRIAEVQTVGKELETALIKDPKNNWLLENWLLYVQELRQLKLREDDLNRRVKEISISDEYHKLREQLNEIQQDLQPGEIGPNILIEKEIMNKIVAVLDEHQKIRDEMDQSMRHSRKTVFDIQKILNEKNCNFSNFDPIFTSNSTPKFDIFC